MTAAASPPRRQEYHVPVTLSDDEHVHLVFVAVTTGVSVGELLRRTYFGEPTDERPVRADHP